jgi:hypothetical protein
MSEERGLNWTQEFTFETDKLESLEALLSCALPILFPRGGNLERATENEDHWPSESAAYFIVKYPGGLSADPEVWLNKRQDKHVMHRQVCVLTGEVPPFVSGDAPTHLGFRHTVHEVMRHIRNASTLEGSDINPFSAGDGGIRSGYRAHFSSRFQRLVISLCYIYLPK